MLKSAPLPTLNYRTPQPAARPWWVYVLVGLYFSVVLGLIVLWVMNLFEARHEADAWPWILLSVGILFLAGGGLLILVPARAQRGRPLTRRSIWSPLAGSLLLVALLSVGGAIATIELLKVDWDNRRRIFLAIWTTAGAAWLLWAVVFWCVSRSLDPVTFSARMYKAVLGGSLLELAIAVPMHLVVRRRTECCAGILTAAAICLGTIAAVISLGPGVYFLYHRRWKQFYSHPSESR